MKQYKTKYGKWIITGEMISATIRKDHYLSDDPARGESVNYCHVLSALDESAPVTSDRDSAAYRDYSPKCSHCYLNNNHSTDAHDYYTV